MTRKWKDNVSLMERVRLFFIDEVRYAIVCAFGSLRHVMLECLCPIPAKLPSSLQLKSRRLIPYFLLVIPSLSLKLTSRLILFSEPNVIWPSFYTRPNERTKTGLRRKSLYGEKVVLH